MKHLKKYNESVSVGIESQFNELQNEYEKKLALLTKQFISEIESCFYDLSDNFESTSPKIVSEFRPKECISRYNSEIQKSILSKTGIKYQKTFIITQPKIENFIEIFNESNEFIKSYIGKDISLINLDILTERHGIISSIGNPKLDDLFKYLNHHDKKAKLKISVGF
jgi:hypothetical protein